MSMARKCDRCGKFYEKNSAKWEDYSVRSVACGFTINGYHTDLIPYDLCDQCVNDLKVFMGIKHDAVKEDKNGEERTE